MTDSAASPPSTAASGPVDAVVFDFDGVVLESHEIKTDAFAELFRREFSDDAARAIHAYHMDNFGVSRYEKFAWYYREHLGEVIAEAESDRLGRAFSDLVYEQVLASPFVPGARESIEELAYAGVPLFVASGTPYPELHRIVESRGLAPFFTEVWGSPAPKPAILRDLMDRYGFAPEAVLFLGDGRSDWEAACETGVRFLARATDGTAEVWEDRGAEQVPDLTTLTGRVAR